MKADSPHLTPEKIIEQETNTPWMFLSSYIDSHRVELLRACKSIAFALGATDKGDTAEIGLEIFSEMTLQARTTGSRYDPTRPPGPWLRKIAVRTAQKRAEQEQRRRTNEVSLESTVNFLFDLSPSPEERVQDWAAVESLLAPLSQEARSLVLKVAVQDWDMQQVGEELGISASTARQRYHRALQTLRNSPIVQQWVNLHSKGKSK